MYTQKRDEDLGGCFSWEFVYTKNHLDIETKCRINVFVGKKKLKKKRKHKDAF